MPTDRDTRSVVNPSDLNTYFHDLNIDDDYDCYGSGIPSNDECDGSWIYVEHKKRQKLYQRMDEKVRLLKAAQDIETFPCLEADCTFDQKYQDTLKYERKGDGSRKNKKEIRRLKLKLRIQKRNERLAKAEAQSQIEPHTLEDDCPDLLDRDYYVCYDSDEDTIQGTVYDSDEEDSDDDSVSSVVVPQTVEDDYPWMHDGPGGHDADENDSTDDEFHVPLETQQFMDAMEEKVRQAQEAATPKGDWSKLSKFSQEENIAMKRALEELKPLEKEDDPLGNFDRMVDKAKEMGLTTAGGDSDDWMTHVENLIIMIYQVSRAENYMDIFVAIMAYIKMNTSKSMVRSLIDLIDDISETSEETEPHAITGREVMESWKMLRANPNFSKISYLISAAMSLSICSVKSIEWDVGCVKMIHIKATEKQLEAVDIIDACIETFTWLSETGYQVFQEKSLKPILYADKEMREYNELCDFVLAHAETVLTGSGPDDMETFSGKVSKVMVRTCELKALQTTGPTAFWLQDRYAKLVAIKQKIIAKKKNSAVRFCPMGWAIIGTSGIGKTSLTQITMMTSLKALGFPTDAARIIARDIFDKYDSTYAEDVLGVIMDDFANGKSNFMDVAPTSVIIKFFNNMAAQAVKAELNAKGTTFIEFKVGVVTSNVRDLDARSYSNCPESILRRFLHVLPSVKPKYRKPGSLALNSSHPDLKESSLVDVWDLTIEEVVIFENKKGEDSYRFQVAKIPLPDGTVLLCKDLNLKQYLDAVIWFSRQHALDQNNYLKRTKEIQESPMCDKCCRYSALCDCVDKVDVHSLVDNIGKTVVDSTVNAAKEYVSSWFAPLRVINNLLGFRPVKIMATDAIEEAWHEILNDDMTPWLISATPDWLWEKTFFQKYVGWWNHSAAMYDVRKPMKRLTFWSTVLLGWCMYTHRWSWFFLVLMFSWIWTLRLWKSFCDRKKHYKELYVKRRDALPAHQKNNSKKWIVEGAIAAGAIVLGIKFYYMWQKAQPHAQDADTTTDEGGKKKEEPTISREEVEGQPGWFSYFTQPLGMKVTLSDESKTATATQFASTIRKNVFWCTYKRENGETGGSNIFFPCKGVALVPSHLFYEGADMNKKFCDLLEFTAYRGIVGPSNKIKFKARATLSGHDEKLDVYLVRVPNCPDLVDQRKWFPLDQPTGKTICRITGRDKENTVVTSRMEVTFGEVSHKFMKFYGGSYHTKLAQNGMCMSVVSTDIGHPSIVGLHIGGIAKTGYGVMMTVTKEQYDGLEKDLESKPGVMLSAVTGELPKEQFGKPLLASDTVHPHCMAATLGPDACVEILGATHLRAQFKSTVTTSPLSSHVERICGIPNQWGMPKLRPNWKGFNATLQHIVNPSEMFDPQLLERARRDWIDPLIALMRVHMTLEVFRPLTLKESILGIPGLRFMTALVMSTGMGFPVFGKKSKWFEDVWVDGVLVDRIPHEMILAELNRLFDCWDRGVRAYPVTTATLKDEPTKLSSEKVRVFQAAPIAMSIAIRMYFLPICRFLHLHPLEAESAVGVNAFSKQWEKMMGHATKFAEDDVVIAWDYSKYDVRMNSQMTTAAWMSFIELAEAGGYDQTSLRRMRMMISDIVHPLIDYNGVMLMALNMNTSGNNMTVDVNSTAGSLFVRMGFFHTYPQATDFRKHVAALTYGDDFKGSVHKDYRDFNFKAFHAFMGAHGMKITLPDKSEDQRELYDAEADFLKRNSNYIPEIGRSIGCLGEDSIWKSLHANLRSSSISQEEVAASCVETAMHEWFGHGREVYDLRQKQMIEVCEAADLPVSAVHMSFDERVEKWHSKYSSED